MNEEGINKTRDLTAQHETDGKLDKSVELDASMTILESQQDEYEQAIKTIGGR